MNYKVTTLLSLARNILHSQRGAMFGMDARIALIIASVLAATGGVTVMSRLERGKIDYAERGVEIIRSALDGYYRTIGIDTMAANVTALFDNALIEETTLAQDPWGNAWNYTTVSYIETLDSVNVTVHLATIHSNGKDGANSSTAITNDTDYAAWAPAGDDIGVKYSTILIEKDRVERYREQARQVIDKLNAHEASRYLTADSTCTATPADAICTHDSVAAVTRPYNKYNYYPQSTEDAASDAIYYDPTVSTAQQSFTSGNLADMQTLMTTIGLPTSFAIDPWNRTLFYSSNTRVRDEPPFTAAVCYSSAGTCF